MKRQAVLAVLLCTAAAGAQAVTVESMQVDRSDGSYRITSTLIVDVPLATAFRAASDYERMPEYNPSVVSNARLGGHRLRSDVHFCVAFFCRSIRQVVRYHERAPHAIDMQVVAGEGDLKSGHLDWRFTAGDAGHTRLRLDAAVEPAFWVPPLIGPWLIARELRHQATVTGRAIERLAADYGQAPASGPSERQR